MVEKTCNETLVTLSQYKGTIVFQTVCHQSRTRQTHGNIGKNFDMVKLVQKKTVIQCHRIFMMLSNSVLCAKTIEGHIAQELSLIA